VALVPRGSEGEKLGSMFALKQLPCIVDLSLLTGDRDRVLRLHSRMTGSVNWVYRCSLVNMTNSKFTAWDVQLWGRRFLNMPAFIVSATDIKSIHIHEGDG
jgi:hypothetical protein